MDSYGDPFALGVESMDTEHRRLATLFSQFTAAIQEDETPDRARDIVQEALALANEHFAHEEEMMAATAYPATEEEKFHHRNLRLQITTLVGDTLSMPACSQVMLENLAEMERLLFEHINGPDRDLAAYLNAQGIR
jgi:hemerythrin-like metal-binding protein